MPKCTMSRNAPPKIEIRLWYKISTAQGTISLKLLGGKLDPKLVYCDLKKELLSLSMLYRMFQGGLFEDIASGLQHAKIIVACLSDEVIILSECSKPSHSIKFNYIYQGKSIWWQMSIVDLYIKWNNVLSIYFMYFITLCNILSDGFLITFNSIY